MDDLFADFWYDLPCFMVVQKDQQDFAMKTMSCSRVTTVNFMSTRRGKPSEELGVSSRWPWPRVWGRPVVETNRSVVFVQQLRSGKERSSQTCGHLRLGDHDPWQEILLGFHRGKRKAKSSVCHLQKGKESQIPWKKVPLVGICW